MGLGTTLGTEMETGEGSGREQSTGMGRGTNYVGGRETRGGGGGNQESETEKDNVKKHKS